jgi:hypothetical protein
MSYNCFVSLSNEISADYGRLCACKLQTFLGQTFHSVFLFTTATLLFKTLTVDGYTVLWRLFVTCMQPG